MRRGDSRLNIEALFAAFLTSKERKNKLRGATNPGGTLIKINPYGLHLPRDSNPLSQPVKFPIACTLVQKLSPHVDTLALTSDKIDRWTRSPCRSQEPSIAQVFYGMPRGV